MSAHSKPKILITGASRGLGKVLVEHFSQDWDVIPFTRKDLDFTQIDPFWHTHLPHGEIEAIIHCAGGGLGLRGCYLEPKSFHALFMINLGGAMEINRRLLPEMQARRYGRVVHVCSIASGEAIGSVGYNTIKAALGAYTRSLGRELAPYGVVVSGIAPGGFTGPQNSMERLKERNPEAYADFLKNRLPRGYMGKAEELIPLLKYLVSKEASMMSGCVVPIDGGEGHYYST